MTIKFTASSLIVNGETMAYSHTKKAIADHIKQLLFKG